MAAWIAAGLLGPWVLPIIVGPHLGVNAVRVYLESFGTLASFVYIALLVLFIIIPPLPDLVLVVPAGLLFGLLRGTIYTLLGALLGAVICFWIARRFGRAWLFRQMAPQARTRVDSLTDRLGWPTLFFSRLVPGFPFQLASYAAGLTKMSLLGFVTATLTGMLLPATLTVAIGNGAGERPGLAIALMVLGLLGWALVPIAVVVGRTVWSE